MAYPVSSSALPPFEAPVSAKKSTMLALTWQGNNSVVKKSMPVPHLVDPIDAQPKTRRAKRARNKYLDIEAEVDDSDEEIEDEEEGFGPDDGFIDEEDIYNTASSCIRAAADNANLDVIRRLEENQTAEEWTHNAEEMARNFRKKYRRIAGR
ncbi:unnamed protein product, partial [Tilletia caries]